MPPHAPIEKIPVEPEPLIVEDLDVPKPIIKEKSQPLEHLFHEKSKVPKSIVLVEPE